MQEENPKNLEYFGHRLKKFRIAAGYGSPGDFANKANVSRSTAYEWEKRETPPPPSQIAKICEALGITPMEILYGKSEKTRQCPMDYASETLSKLGRETPSAEDCMEYFRNFLDRAVEDDTNRLGWTWMELFERFPLDKWRK